MPCMFFKPSKLTRSPHLLGEYNFFWIVPCGLYYKPMTIVNDDSRVMVVNKLEASLTDDARVIIYDCQMFIGQATDCGKSRHENGTGILEKHLTFVRIPKLPMT